MEYADIDRIYRTIPLEKIPWNIEAPPHLLVRLVKEGMIKPCKAIDLGCGTGNYAIYLAEQGFDVTGVDSSATAIQIAAEKARERGVSCRFIQVDLLGEVHEIPETFDFAYDWELLHHIFPEDRERYIHNVYSVLNSSALYLSVSFSEKDPQFRGSGKYRRTPIGTTLYFSSEEEVRGLISPCFTILHLRTIEIAGKSGNHCAVCSLAKKG